jgi:hypothetical protein
VGESRNKPGLPACGTFNMQHAGQTEPARVLEKLSLFPNLQFVSRGTTGGTGTAPRHTLVTLTPISASLL